MFECHTDSQKLKLRVFFKTHNLVFDSRKWHLLSCNDWELYGAFFKHPIKSHGHYHSSNMEIVKTSAMFVIAIIL